MKAKGKTLIVSLAVLGVAGLTGCVQIGTWTGEYVPRQPMVVGAGGQVPASTMTTASPNATDFNTSVNTVGAPPPSAPPASAEATTTTTTTAAAAAPAPMAPARLSAALDGTKEVPINFSTAVGHADVTYDHQTRMLAWTVSFENLSGPAKAAHFHGPADPGSSAGVQLNIGESGLASPLQGAATLTVEQAADLLAGRWYVNIHTAQYPDGEIRGWVKPEGAM